jgi:hypothetical protein
MEARYDFSDISTITGATQNAPHSTRLSWSVRERARGEIGRQHWFNGEAAFLIGQITAQRAGSVESL